MSPAAQRRVSKAVVGLDSEVRQASFRDAIEAFGDVALALGENADRDQLLHLCARKMCELVGVQRASLYLREERGDLFRGQVGHPISAGDRLIKRLVGGVAADRFTQEIVRTRKPVVIRDALRDGRAVRSTMQAWNVRSMMGVPMLLRDEVIGLVFLDSEDHVHHFDSLDEEVACAFAGLAAVAISQNQLLSDLRASRDAVAHRNQALRRAAAVDDRLTALVVSGGSLREIAETATDLTGKACAIFDPSMRRLTSAPADREAPALEGLADDSELAAALARIEPSSPTVVGPFPRLGIQHRLLLTRVTASDVAWGVFALVESAGRFSDYDVAISRRVAGIIALEMSAERRAAAAELNARSSLAAQLVYGSRDPAGLARRADYLGVDLAAPHALCLIAARGTNQREVPDAELIAQALRDTAPSLSVLSTGTAEGIVTIVALPPAPSNLAAMARVKQLMEALRIRCDPEGRLAVGISTTCRGPDDYARAYGQARQVLSCVDAYCPPGSSPVLSADDLGAGRVLLSGSRPEEMRRFADEMLGPLLDERAPAELVETLVCFFECGRNVRRSAVRLDLHENTIRYRLAKIQELTGLDVATDADVQLGTQVALLVLRLQGRLSPPL